MKSLSHPICWLLLIAALFLVAGCAGLDSENASARPWNSPRGFDTGVPGGGGGLNRR